MSLAGGFHSLQVKPPTEFQAVILVGFGSRLSAMTEDEVVPKGLLPIANKPLLYYQLQWLENACVSDIIVVCQPSARQRLNDYLYRVYEGANETKIELVVSDGDSGSADALRGIKDKIKSDVIVISSDLIIEFPPHILIDGFRALNGSMTALFYEVCKGDTECRSSKDEDLSDVVGIDLSRARLLTLESKVDIDEQLSFRLSLLKKFPVINICTQYRDAHLYVFKKWILDFLGAKKGIHSIRNDLLPILLKCQYDDEFAQKEGIHKCKSYKVYSLLDLNAMPNLLADAYLLSTTGMPDSIQSQNTWTSGQSVSESTSSALAPASDSAGVCSERIVCNAIIVREKDGFCARANTVGTYLDANLKMAKLVAASRPPNKAEIGPKSQIGNDCMIGDSSKIGERTSVKRSVIGAHCTIGKNAKISDSVIMDYAIVEDNCKIEGTVVCSGAKVHEKCSLKDCEVASGYTVEKETSSKGESFIDYGE